MTPAWSLSLGPAMLRLNVTLNWCQDDDEDLAQIGIGDEKELLEVTPR